MTEFTSPFAARLRRFRIDAGFRSPEEASTKTLTASSIRKWETGTVPMATGIVELAKRYKVTSDQLLGI